MVMSLARAKDPFLQPTFPFLCSQLFHVYGSDPATLAFSHALAGVIYKTLLEYETVQPQKTTTLTLLLRITIENKNPTIHFPYKNSFSLSSPRTYLAIEPIILNSSPLLFSLQFDWSTSHEILSLRFSLSLVLKFGLQGMMMMSIIQSHCRLNPSRGCGCCQYNQ